MSRATGEGEMKTTDRYGYDADGRWHDPQIDGLHMDCQAIRERRQDPDHSPHGTGVIYAALISIPIWIAIIWFVVHFAQKWGLPW